MAYVYNRAKPFCLGWALAAIVWAVPVLSARPVAAAEVRVPLDTAKLIRLPDKVATIVIGNPLIADASVQPGGLMVVTGKSYGMTNIVVLDRAGAVLMENNVEVEGPAGNVVVLYKGIERETYSCTPSCERRVTLGDSNTVFEANIAQIGSRSGMAQGGTPPAK